MSHYENQREDDFRRLKVQESIYCNQVKAKKILEANEENPQLAKVYIKVRATK